MSDPWAFQRDPPCFVEALEEFRAVTRAWPRPAPPANQEEEDAIVREAARAFGTILADKQAAAVMELGT